MQCSISPATIREWAFEINYNLTYNGNQQQLVTLKNSQTAPGLNTKYNLMFSYDNSTWSYNVPVATNAGDCTFWVKAVVIDGNYTPDLQDDYIGSNHITTEPVQYTVTMQKANMSGFTAPRATGTLLYNGAHQNICIPGTWNGTPKGTFYYTVKTKSNVNP
jgi:hypothetical protein